MQGTPRRNCPLQCLKHRAVKRAYGQDGWGDYLREISHGMDPDTAKNKTIEWFWDSKKAEFKNAELGVPLRILGF